MRGRVVENYKPAKSCASTGKYRVNKNTSVTVELIKQTAQLHKRNLGGEP